MVDATVRSGAGIQEGSIGWLSWQRPLIGVERVAEPVWQGAPPDEQRLRSAFDAQLQEHHHQLEQTMGLRSALNQVARVAYVAVIAGVIALFLAGGALVSWATAPVDPLGGAITAFGGRPMPGSATMLLLLAAFAPWFGAGVIVSSRRVSGRTTNFWLWGLLLWGIAVILGFFTFFASFGLVAALVGVLVLLLKPKVVDGQGTVRQLPKSLLAMTAETKQGVADWARRINGVILQADDRVRSAHEHHHQELEQFRAARANWQPYRAVAAAEHTDILVSGGGPGERGDLVHHLAASTIERGGAVWILDLEGLGATDRVRGGASSHSVEAGLLPADSDTALAQALDRLGGIGGSKLDALGAVLASTMAADATDASTASIRSARHWLTDIRRVIGTGTVARYRAALDVLLGRRQARPTNDSVGFDDFGSAEATGATTGSPLTGEETARLRELFTDHDRQTFHREWTTLRDALASIDDEHDSYPTASTWHTQRQLRVASMPQRLSADERALRSRILVGHHLEILRSNTDRPDVLVVLGADRAPESLLREISDAAGHTRTQLVLLFSEYNESFDGLARGKRAIAVFGGNGARASEELAEQFGKGWVERVQSVQETWSQSDALSRSESAGRNWSRGSNRGWGESDRDATGIFGRDLTSSESWGTNESEGGTWSETSGRTRTDQSGGARTVGAEYTVRRTGEEIANLPPFVLLYKTPDNIVRVLDVNARFVLPPAVVQRELGQAGRRPGVGAGAPQARVVDQSEPSGNP